MLLHHGVQFLKIYCVSGHSEILFVELPAVIYPDKTTVVGQEVTIPCNSSNSNPVNWWYQRTADRPVQELCVNGELVNGHTERFSLNPSNYDLTLLSAKWTDSGLYSCVEDTAFGTRHIVRLIVRGTLNDVFYRGTIVL